MLNEGSLWQCAVLAKLYVFVVECFFCLLVNSGFQILKETLFD